LSGKLLRSLPSRYATPQELISSFLKHFSGVAAYLEATRAAARRDGGVATLAGRRRPIKGLGATDKRCAWGWWGLRVQGMRI